MFINETMLTHFMFILIFYMMLYSDNYAIMYFEKQDKMYLFLIMADMKLICEL